MRTRVAAAVAAALLLALPRPAAAADSAQKAACLRASDEGQRLRVAGRLREARSAFLVCAKDQCPAVVRDDCAAWTGEVTDAMPSVIFGARDGTGHPLAAVTIEVDGETLATRLDGTPVLLDPGDHHVRFAHAGSRSVERTVTLAKGEKRRSIVIDFDAAEAPSAPVTVVAPLPVTTTTTTTLPPLPPPAKGGAARYVGPVAFGVAGVAALGVGTYLLVHASRDVSTLESTCSPFCGHDAVDRLRNRALAGDVLLGIGATSLLAAGYLFFFTQPRSSDAPQRSARADGPFDLGVTPGRDGGQAVFRGTF